MLDELDEHLDDNHLHIIAPPGSGKTVLGLEVALRINKPTLIFAPTVAIKNQWIQRFCELFLQIKRRPDWISRDIKNPGFLTVVTYQALHAAMSGETPDEEHNDPDEENEQIENSKKSTGSKEVISRLLAQKVGTIVVDEAHHLKNAWWQSLTEIKKALNPTIVGLTATPPYDVSHAEWQRYLELNGPVDAEISVPELIVEGDLCPHQDYVFFSRPTIEESRKIGEYRDNIERLFKELVADLVLIEALQNHPIYQSPYEQLDWIYTNLEYYSATLIFLNAAGKKITPEHLEIVGDMGFDIPELNYEWIEILLTFFLYKDPGNFSLYKEYQQKLTRKLKRSGIIEKRSISFGHNHNINRYLSASINKLKCIHRIVDFEHDQLKQDLRMVILTDYIRKEFLVNLPENDLELNKIGVVPIFEQLRRANDRGIKTGVLTGSLIIIPVTAFDAFSKAAAKYKIEQVSGSPLPYDDKYILINTTDRLKNDIVHIVTQVFQQGHIEVLIGTKSLLGEGWDAPAINSLILASFVGSYVLSNQMRGRAIRTQHQNEAKTANIWHLVCIDPTSPDGGNDIALLKRRFKAFVGVSFREEVSIENGIGRLNLPEELRSEKTIEQANTDMLHLAGKRNSLKQNWQQALDSGVTLIEEIKVPFPKDQNYKEVQSLYYNKTIKNLFAMLGAGLTGFGAEVLQAFGDFARQLDGTPFMNWLMVIGLTGILVFGRLTYKTFRAYVKYRDISKDIQQIGEALLESLIHTGTIHTDREKLTVFSEVDDFGAIYCRLKGGTTYEKSAFIKSLQEIIGTVENPRYVIIRKSFFLNVFSQNDYHSVPEILGRKKQFAQHFKQQWARLVGACELVYTRTVEGRKILLKSRIQSLASEFQDKAERINKWR